MLGTCGRACHAFISYREKPSSSNEGKASLPDGVNAFYGLFEREFNAPSQATRVSKNTVVSVTDVNARRSFTRVNYQKATNPEGVPGHVFTTCTD